MTSLFQGPLPQNSSYIFNSLQTSMKESSEYEMLSKIQTQSDIWHRLRENRLTSSNFKKVCSRQSNFENLALQLNKKTSNQRP